MIWLIAYYLWLDYQIPKRSLPEPCIFRAMSFGFGAATSFEQRCAGKSSAAQGQVMLDDDARWKVVLFLSSLWRRHKAEDDYS